MSNTGANDYHRSPLKTKTWLFKLLGTIRLGGSVIRIRMRFIGLSPATIVRTFRKKKRNVDIRTINEIMGDDHSLTR